MGRGRGQFYRIGYGKLKHLQQEHGDAVSVLRAIKTALDPDNRMNPGKMIPPIAI